MLLCCFSPRHLRSVPKERAVGILPASERTQRWIRACRRRRYKYRLVVDESFALGVLGGRGRGAAEAAGLSPSDVDILCASLGGFGAQTSDLEPLNQHAAGMRLMARTWSLLRALSCRLCDLHRYSWPCIHFLVLHVGIHL